MPGFAEIGIWDPLLCRVLDGNFLPEWRVSLYVLLPRVFC